MDINFIEKITTEILKKASKKKITIRVCGSYGIYLVSLGLQDWIKKESKENLNGNYFEINWKEPRDIDFVALMKDHDQVKHILQNLGFKENRSLSSPTSSFRNIFLNSKIRVDVSYNILDFNHRIDLRIKNFHFNNHETDRDKIRLQVAEKTIPKTELLLHKLQIVNPGRKDLIDTWWILNENKIKNSSDLDIDNGINPVLINHYIGRDWGFYYTIMKNLDRLEDLITSINPSEENNTNVLSNIRKLKQLIDECPKSLAWNFRSKIGAKVQWYSDVEEVRKL